MSVKPLEDRVLIKPIQAETKTKSGIYLPESAKEKPQQAKVIAVGEGKVLDNGERAKPTLKKGDTIILSKWGGTELKLDGEEYLIINSSDVLAIVD